MNMELSARAVKVIEGFGSIEALAARVKKRERKERHPSVGGHYIEGGLRHVMLRALGCGGATTVEIGAFLILSEKSEFRDCYPDVERDGTELPDRLRFNKLLVEHGWSGELLPGNKVAVKQENRIAAKANRLKNRRQNLLAELAKVEAELQSP